MSRRALLPLLVVTVFLGGLLAGCGGSRAPAKTAAVSDESTQFISALKFARCMRSHGEPSFPDPRNPGGFSAASLAAVNTSAPAFVSATDTCDKVLPNGGRPTAAEFQQAMGDGVTFAKCMRAHHVFFPDPGIDGSHLTIDLSNVDTNSPAYARASKTCATPPGG